MINLFAEGELKRSIEKLVHRRTRRHGRSRGAQRRKLRREFNDHLRIQRRGPRITQKRAVGVLDVCGNKCEDRRPHTQKYIEASHTHLPSISRTRNPAKEHTPTDYLTSQKTATKIALLPQNAQISTFVQFSSIASSYHPTLSTSSSHTSFYQPLPLLLQLLSHLSLSFHIPIHSPIQQPQKWNQQLFPALAFQANPNTSTHSCITPRSLPIVSISSLVLCSCINLSHKCSI